jgi:Zn-dependent peptidase ImmA (M78 family)
LKFRYGFKAECERISLEMRAELGLTPSCRLDPHALAEHLAIPTRSLDDFGDSCVSEVEQLVRVDQGSFSAATVFRGTQRLIIFNPAHPPGRHVNSVAHELSHIILEHEPGPIREAGGERRWAPDDEAEADWLAGTLLAPREGVLQMMSRLGSIERAAQHFGISEALMRWRLNHTGVARQMLRAKAAR